MPNHGLQKVNFVRALRVEQKFRIRAAYVQNLNLQPKIFLKVLRIAYTNTQPFDPRLYLKRKKTRMEKIQSCLQESLFWNYNDGKRDPRKTQPKQK